MSKDHKKSKVDTKTGYFEPDTLCHTEITMARAIRKEILQYLEANNVSVTEFGSTLSWSEEATIEYFRKNNWGLERAIRMADHLHFQMRLKITPPENFEP